MGLFSHRYGFRLKKKLSELQVQIKKAKNHIK